MMPDRGIAAIVAADVAKHTPLMGVDEESSLIGRKLCRSIFDQLVAECGGHEFASVGDSLMVEFSSAVNAQGCAQLQLLAKPSDVLTSCMVYDRVRNKSPVRFITALMSIPSSGIIWRYHRATEQLSAAKRETTQSCSRNRYVYTWPGKAECPS
jgi:class 3 adenylate cyclase